VREGDEYFDNWQEREGGREKEKEQARKVSGEYAKGEPSTFL